MIGHRARIAGLGLHHVETIHLAGVDPVIVVAVPALLRVALGHEVPRVGQVPRPHGSGSRCRCDTTILAFERS